MKRLRCAIYTRKSSEEGLEQDFNSLDAQREACEAFIASQKHEGWELIPERFDDGGISGGHLDRPGLKNLFKAVDEKRIDQIVVYKIDRLTRSLSDFAKLVDRMDAAQTSFVSVTQSFNTATSMGRLTLNMLLSFAQFEREVTAERIRDKIAASKRKGMWMGGYVPLGYDADGRTLKINEDEAQTVKELYALYLEHQNIADVKAKADALGLRSKRRERAGGRVSGGNSFDRGHIHHILTNPLYVGRIRHKQNIFEGQHPAIIEPTHWDQVQEMLQKGAAKARGVKPQAQSSNLAGKLYDETGDRLTPSHSRKNGKRLRYYVSHRLIKDRRKSHPDAWRLPAAQLETLLGRLIQRHLAKPETALTLTQGMQAEQVVKAQEALKHSQSSSETLKLIERVDLSPGEVSLKLDTKRIAELLGCEEDRIDQVALILHAPFQTRRRGVELKLVLGGDTPEIDKTLVRNLVKARYYLTQIIEGKTTAEIAKAEGTSRRRVQDVLGLAFLAPDIIEAIAEGTQPVDMTSDKLIKNGVPAIWSDQRAELASL